MPTAVESDSMSASRRPTLGARCRHAARSASFWAVVVYIVSRIGFYAFFSAATSDIWVYLNYVVQGVDYGRTPYLQSQPSSLLLRDIKIIEYPPTGYWVMALPRMLSHWRMPPEPTDPALADAYGQKLLLHYAHYDYGFRGLMLLFDIGAFSLFALILRRRRPEYLAWGLWGYVIGTSALGYVLLERFDICLTFCLMAWAYCWLRADDASPKSWLWSVASYAALGLGISLKLIPVIIVPFPLLADLHSLWRKPRNLRLLAGPVALCVTGLGPFAYYYALVGDDLWNMFEFHTVRGVQIESSYATVMMLALPADQLRCYYGYGSWNLGGAWEADLLVISSWLLPAVLLLFGFRALFAPALRETFDRSAAYRWACVTIPTATLLAKVFSVQYLLWAVPMLLLAGTELLPRRGFYALVAGSIVACGLTGLLFPHHYLDQMYALPYSAENPPPFTLIEHRRLIDNERGEPILSGDLSTAAPRTMMTARNVIFAALCAAVTVAVMRRRR
ncbi:MAG: hypothetical protein C0483_23465 [Pirellula sp.]|nr:hypothetical protein [Pirellula sp.]